MTHWQVRLVHDSKPVIKPCSCDITDADDEPLGQDDAHDGCGHILEQWASSSEG